MHVKMLTGYFSLIPIYLHCYSFPISCIYLHETYCDGKFNTFWLNKVSDDTLLRSCFTNANSAICKILLTQIVNSLF